MATTPLVSRACTSAPHIHHLPRVIRWPGGLRRTRRTSACTPRRNGDAYSTERHATQAAADCARTYRAALRELAGMPVLDAFYLATDEKTVTHFDVGDLGEVFKRIGKKARKNTSRRVVEKFAERAEHTGWRFTPDPPLLTRIDDATAQAVLDARGVRRHSLEGELRYLLSRYAVADIAHRVVGLGSVGRRSYVVLLHGNGEDPLVLQVKEARASALAPVRAARPLRARRRADRPRPALDADRQRHPAGLDDDRRAAVPGPPVPRHEGQHRPGPAQADQLDDYARVISAVLARAHAQSADPRILTGYCDGAAAPTTQTGSTPSGARRGHRRCTGVRTAAALRRPAVRGAGAPPPAAPPRAAQAGRARTGRWPAPPRPGAAARRARRRRRPARG